MSQTESNQQHVCWTSVVPDHLGSLGGSVSLGRCSGVMWVLRTEPTGPVHMRALKVSVKYETGTLYNRSHFICAPTLTLPLIGSHKHISQPNKRRQPIRGTVGGS